MRWCIGRDVLLTQISSTHRRRWDLLLLLSSVLVAGYEPLDWGKDRRAALTCHKLPLKVLSVDQGRLPRE